MMEAHECREAYPDLNFSYSYDLLVRYINRINVIIFMPKISFEERYKEEKCYWGSKPNKEVINLLKYKQSGKALDLGVGEGRNALFLAKKGFNITGVDSSKAGIEKFLKLAKKFKVKVRGIVAEITKFKFDKFYEVIISTATLHFLSRKDIDSIIRKMKEKTNKEGLNLITVFTVEDPGFKTHPEKMYYFQKSELQNFYKDWKILNYREFLTKLEKHGKDGKWHKHGVAVLLARKF